MAQDFQSPSDDVIEEFFQIAVDQLPEHDQEAFRQWLAERQAAFRLCQELCSKGLEALL